MYEIIFITLLVLFAIGGIWAFVVTKKVKKEGYETDAVISRIELQEWSGGIEPWEHGSVTKDYYITFKNHEGQTVESLLSNPGDHEFKKGDRIRIKYLPDRHDYPVLVKTL